MWFLRSVSLCIFFLTFPPLKAFIYLIPQNIELKYNWKAEMKVGTHLPANVASKLELHGRIDMQKNNNNSIFAKIANLTYKICNESVDQTSDFCEKFTSSEIDDLGNMFEMVYSNDGLIEKVVTNKEEKEFSRNVKRALSVILQMKTSILMEQVNQTDTFSVKENSLNGFEDVIYSVVSTKGEFEVTKMQNATQDYDLYSSENSEVVKSTSRRSYKIVKTDDGFVAKTIVVDGTVLYSPFLAKSDSQFIEVRQNFVLSEAAAVVATFQMNSDVLSTNVTYISSLKSNEGRGEDFTHGGHTTISEIIPTVKKFLSETRDVNRAQTLLRLLNSQELHQLQDSLESGSDFFYHILPLVDTDASKLLIKDLVVNRQVDDKIAFSLLKNMGDSDLNLALLQQLEELIHLDQSYSWEVRKVALLSFATLIHKSYQQTNNEQAYEKYVQEYIRGARQLSDYKIRQVYIFGLYNMKLPLLMDYLKPGFNGDWWQDKSLRYLCLWAAVQSGTHFETLWSIFTNSFEEIEIRLLAFVHIMQAQPNLSVLQMISKHMLNEPSEEICNFYYTYLSSVLENKQPQLQKWRLKVAQIFKQTPQPKYGISTIKNFGFTDPNWGFRSSLESHFIRTKADQIYKVFLKSQDRDEYSGYLRIHDNQHKHLFPTRTILDALYYFYKRSENKKTPGSFIEGAVLKRGQIVNAYYFTGAQTNLVVTLTQKLFTDPSALFEILHISYHRYERTVIPTDLGLPVLWEFLKPAFYQNKVLDAARKYSRGHTFEFSFGSNFVASFHYRHGLSFYNPFKNLWQGINRYQTFDIKVPLDLRIRINSEQKLLNLTWNQLEASLESCTKQMTFLRDDLGVEQATAVTVGKDFRHNYTLVDKEFKETGLKFTVGVYDSSRRFSPGFFVHQLYLFGQSETKHYNSILEHLILSSTHLLKYSALLPEPGIYGVFAKLSLSPKFATSIELSISYRLDYEENIPYVPEYVANTILIYTVNKQSENMATSIINGTLQAKRGHSEGTLNIDITQLERNGRNYKMCARATKKFTLDKVRGTLHITGGNDSTECPDEFKFDLLEIGEPSNDQDGKHLHGNCANVDKSYHTLNCLASQNIIGTYHYDIKYTNMPQSISKVMRSSWDYWKSYYKSYYTFQYETTNVTDGQIKADVTFPIEDLDKLDMEVQTSGMIQRLEGFSNTYWSLYGLFPKMSSYSILFMFFENSGYTNHLVVHADHSLFNGDIIRKRVPKQWTPFLKISNSSQVSVKLVKNHTLAVKIDSDGHLLKIIPYNDKYEIYKDGKLLPSEEQHLEEWMYYHIFQNESGKPLVMFLPISGIHVEYFLNRIAFAVPGRSQYIAPS